MRAWGVQGGQAGQCSARDAVQPEMGIVQWRSSEELCGCLPLCAHLCPWLQLAQMINEKPQLINEYEAGKAIPNPQVGVWGGRRGGAERVA